MAEPYDAIVVGGGPAGLSAAIYLARSLRRTLVLDRGGGRWDGLQVTENYLGFPQGIAARELRARGVEQARRFGADFEPLEVSRIGRADPGFTVETDGGMRRARTVVLATGVTDRYPDVPGWPPFEGAGLHWCLYCDGYLARGRPAAVVGADEASAVEALQLRRFTDRVTLVAPEPPSWSARRDAALARAGIAVVEGAVERLEAGEERRLSGLRLRGGRRVSVEVAFVHQPGRPNSDLARDLGVARSTEGYVKVDSEQRTSAPRVYAAGDVTRLHSHQVVTAAHEGATAAVSANFDLLPPDARP